MTHTKTGKGLAGIVAAESALSFIDGDNGRLSYRGYDIHALAKNASYLEAVYLLWNDALPSSAELAAFEGTLASQRALPPEMHAILSCLPADSSPMAALRTAVSALGLLDPDAREVSRAANLRKAGRLVAMVPTIVAAFDRVRSGKEPIPPDPDLEHAANFLYMLTSEIPSDTASRALDTSLLLYLEHGLNASTFTTRVVASTLADMHGAITAGIAALTGSLHGGANAAAMQMLIEIDEQGAVDDYLDAALGAKRKIMGFGHRVYRTEDPRSTHLRRISEALAAESGDGKWHALALELEAAMFDRKGLYCNVDFYCATVYYSLSLPIDLYTPLFAIGRTGGWAAHVMEQHMDNRLIRPRAEFTGELDRPWVPIDRR